MTKTIKFKEIDSNEENKKINEWVKQQNDFSKSIRKLINLEIKKNGITDILLN